jgi:hypothetical protein
MDNEERRQIIAQVAAGTLSPEEAAARLDEADPAPRGGPAVAVAERPGPQAPARTVRVSISLGQVKVIGDPAIREAVAEGSHTAHHEGDQLFIEGDPLRANGFTFGNSRGWLQTHPWKDPLVVRMNPDLALQVVVQGGQASVRGVRGAIRAEVHAGAIHVDGFEAPIDLEVEAGAVKAAGRLTTGSSRIRCDAGSVNLELLTGSSMRVSARTELGQVKLDGAGWRTETHPRGAKEIAVLGAGAASLEVEVNIGSVKLVAL